MRLKHLGITPLILKDLIQIAKWNVEPECMMDELKRSEPVSIAAAKTSKRPIRLFKALAKLGIYNINTVSVKPGEVDFVCKASSGQILHASFNLTEVLSFKIALLCALESFVTSIKRLPPPKPESEESKAARLKYADELKMLNLNIPEGIELTPELIESLKTVLQGVMAASDIEQPVADVE